MQCKPLVLYILLQSYLPCFSQNKPDVETPEQLVAMYVNLMNSIEEQDSLSELFTQKYINYLAMMSSEMNLNDQAFDTLDGFHIKISTDKKLKIISWDTYTGGTMHFYHTVFQYKSDTAIKMKKYLSGIDSKGDYIGVGSYVMDIFQIDYKGLRYYLPVTQGILSNKDCLQSIQAYIIRDNELDDAVKIFKTEDGLKNSIKIEYNFFSVVDKKQRPIFLFKYDAHHKQIKTAMVDDEGKVLKKWKLVTIDLKDGQI